jgi:hypothetical protein
MKGGRLDRRRPAQRNGLSSSSVDPLGLVLGWEERRPGASAVLSGRFSVRTDVENLLSF